MTEEPRDENAIIEDAYVWLRSATAADLRFDENIRPIKYVTAPDGRLVAPVMVAMLESADTALFVPEYADGAMEVQVTLEQLDESSADGAMTDRWRIHHGDPEDVRWAWFEIDCARFKGHFVDGEALVRENSLADDEPRICQHMNQDHAEDIKLLCKHYANAAVEKPIMVAIDSHGFDVRRRFDIVRVPASKPMPTAEDARRVLKEMIERIRER